MKRESIIMLCYVKDYHFLFHIFNQLKIIQNLFSPLEYISLFKVLKKTLKKQCCTQHLNVPQFSFLFFV